MKRNSFIRRMFAAVAGLAIAPFVKVPKPIGGYVVPHESKIIGDRVFVSISKDYGQTWVTETIDDIGYDGGYGGFSEPKVEIYYQDPSTINWGNIEPSSSNGEWESMGK